MPGRVLATNEETDEDFTGHELDSETGMHYAGARYYMSALGRWNGPDPILGEPSPAKLLKDGKVQAFSMSAYNYGFNNPSNLRDETGKWPTPDTFLDIGFLAYSAYDVVSTAVSGDEVSSTQWAALAADGGSLLIPGATGGGMAVRAATKGDDVTSAIRGIAKATEGGDVALDANALIRGLDFGEIRAVDDAINGRTPVVSITAAKEFLEKGDVGALRQFLKERSGRLGKAATAEQIDALKQQAEVLGRVLNSKDAAVTGSAVNEGATIITRDEQLIRFLNEAGIPAERF